MRGGYRANSGRKRGSLSKKTTEIVQKATENHQTPIEYLISVYTDPTVPRPERVNAAIAACPFMHPRLSSVTLKESYPQVYVQEVNVIGIESGKFLTKEEIEEYAQQSLPPAIEHGPAVVDDERETPWVVADGEAA